MARVTKIPQVFNFLFFTLIFISCSTKLASANIELDEDNWTKILDGEWMVEFYAPWCPACNALSPAWRELSQRSKARRMPLKTAAVDVTKSPGLSGRFMVTALPTIFHVKDSEFRQYKGPRDVDSMLEYVERSRWKQTEAVPSWKAPHSIQMGLVAQFFKLSQALRSVHNMLMETYGLPTWGSYLLFALATIFMGALLGLMLVCAIDMLYPPRKVQVSKEEAKLRGKDDEELINDDIVDDAASSDAEKHSPSDTSEDDKEKESGDKPKAEKTEVRKRRPRKDD
ncbi:thioredoxin-related transmembrane protein 1-like [Aricia agestis]|uniref:thioredoxin-related transmembrane protein 1-like n=1 Tax=Aricia agestis TaxID=91739 RepID=UPI001C205D3D|nr:thioredoxin-related transmembrane protein 1-like [Aricia agestis]XP_041985784.1 thioredoxin-related transmembrane protein 1-like [Aricia agestis]